MMVLTRASIPPTWHTVTLFFWLLHVKLLLGRNKKYTLVFREYILWTFKRAHYLRMPAAQVTMLTSLLPNSWTSPPIRVSMFSSLVPASDRLRRVHRQFWTSRWLACPKCMTRACIPPASTMAGLLLEHTDSTEEKTPESLHWYLSSMGNTFYLWGLSTLSTGAFRSRMTALFSPAQEDLGWPE